MADLSQQLTTRDAALLSWIGALILWIAWCVVRRKDLGLSCLAVIRAFFARRVLAMVLAVVGWQLAVVYGAAEFGLWDSSLVKDTIVLVAVGGFVCGFKALSLMEGKSSWRDEVRALLALVVVIQFISNLRTFPYLVEMAIIPFAVLLGGMQAVANHSDEYKPARAVINGIIIGLGLAILFWSVYRLTQTFDGTEWESVGKSFALGFWLPAALLPAIYLSALVMQYGKVFTVMKIVRPQSISARAQFLLHHGLNLRRLSSFARTPGRAREYARAEGRYDRRNMLEATTKVD